MHTHTQSHILFINSVHIGVTMYDFNVAYEGVCVHSHSANLIFFTISALHVTELDIIHSCCNM